MQSNVFWVGTKVNCWARPSVKTNRGSCEREVQEMYFLMIHIVSCGEGWPRNDPELMDPLKGGGTSARERNCCQDPKITSLKSPFKNYCNHNKKLQSISLAHGCPPWRCRDKKKWFPVSSLRSPPSSLIPVFGKWVRQSLAQFSFSTRRRVLQPIQSLMEGFESSSVTAEITSPASCKSVSHPMRRLMIPHSWS